VQIAPQRVKLNVTRKKTAMADVIDLNEYRRQHADDDDSKAARRRRTPGGHGFGDMSHHLSTAVPGPPDDGNADDEPPEAG